ncbi:GNAT family N-acetyltransferase [Sneathiella sp.]|uniref:GNAT family N-acetyltransferase n=1 Tax=Sneathiella sp. TaxID=1964365 RepID=UPI002FE37C40
MLQQIAEIEAHSLAAIPALRTEVYDGWHLRFARNHTRRANSVNVVTPGVLPLPDKVAYCEKAYAAEKQSCHFRLTPLANEGLDAFLAERGYGFFGATDVRVKHLSEPLTPDSGKDLVSYDPKSEFWLRGVAALTGQDKAKQQIFREMLDLIKMPIHAVGILRGKQIVACGMGVQSDKYLGLFEFATHRKFRRRGFAGRIARHIEAKAQAGGVAIAYLQVVASNEVGQDFWREMGFNEALYRYHYRTRPQDGAAETDAGTHR